MKRTVRNTKQNGFRFLAAWYSPYVAGAVGHFENDILVKSMALRSHPSCVVTERLAPSTLEWV